MGTTMARVATSTAPLPTITSSNSRQCPTTTITATTFRRCLPTTTRATTREPRTSPRGGRDTAGGSEKFNRRKNESNNAILQKYPYKISYLMQQFMLFDVKSG